MKFYIRTIMDSMLKYLVLVAFSLIGFNSLLGQLDERITTMDFVQVVDDNRAEAIYYYQKNWKVLRVKAKNRGYIHSFEFLETPSSEHEPFDFILITTYANKPQYEQREENFGILIEERGSLRLLNDKQPGEFRKNVFFKENVRHWKQGQ